MLAILGTSEHCIATNPSDMNVCDGGTRGKDPRYGKGRYPRNPDQRLLSEAGRDSAARDGARTGRSDHACNAARRPCRTVRRVT